MIAARLHAVLLGLLHAERRIDPFIRPALDAVLQRPAAALVQALLNARRAAEPDGPAQETRLPDEDALTGGIIEAMAAFMRARYAPGGFQRGGNTKTHGVVRGRFEILPDLPPALRQGLFAAPATYDTWVRFAGPGPDSPPDIDDVGVLSIGIKLMGVPGPKLVDDERFTQDFLGISAPTFTTSDIRENIKLQRAIRGGLPLFYFLNLGDSHLLDALMQGLWARTHTSPLETPYWSCVPFLLGEGRAMRFSLHPVDAPRSRVPNLPFRPPDNYLREAMAATLAQREAGLEFRIQLQSVPRHMPIENASILWPERLSPPIAAARLTLPRQTFDSPAQLAFADRLSFNPWHGLPAHRPLGNQNRARLRIYEELARFRQAENGVPHVEPTGGERFDA